MKIPAFLRTIRFRLTIWYVSFLMIVIIALLYGLNLKVGSIVASPTPGGSPSAAQSSSGDVNNFKNDVSRYSITGAVIALVVGSVGIYFLSGTILKPVDRVTSLARRSSFSNLKERLNYTGPNDEIKRLADTFDSMLSRLKNSVDSQKQFVQDAAHELRTPIATALTNIEVLEMNSEATIADYHELLRVLKLSLDRMNKISNSLQLLSEDSNSTTGLDSVNIMGIIAEVVNEATLEASRQDVFINWKQPSAEIFISGDAFLIKQAIYNLVDNATKYNRPGGSVNVEARIENGSALIVVSDTGIGIPSEDLPHVFDRFFRVDKSRSRERGGSGLGLAIVKKVVEDHHGSVCVDSILGSGSTFRVNLPLSAI
jgi:signal transduction histidine kinase